VWQPLSVVRGVPEGTSAVTVMAAMAPRQIMNEWTTDPREILETFAAEMRANQLHYSIYGGNYVIVIPKQLREHFERAGWSKQTIAEFLHERARVLRSGWADAGKRAVVLARRSVDRGCWRPCRWLRRGDPAVDGQQKPRSNRSDRRVR
jgi:hypothetical protein